MSKKVCLWSGPRNISTSMMYSFAQRDDTKVFDEPFYGYYLSKHPRAKYYHPMAEEIVNTMITDGMELVEWLMSHKTESVYFFKQMTHHLLDLDLDFLSQTLNIILTRDPMDMLPSYQAVIDRPNLDDVGYKRHTEIMDYMDQRSISYIVVESKRFLSNPETQLREMCKWLQIDFDSNMLEWNAGPIPEDGIWADYWYTSIHNSTGFRKYTPKEKPFPEELKPLLAECMPYYNRLLERAI